MRKGSPPHNGEPHTEGDKLVYLMSGNISVLLEEQPPQTIQVELQREIGYVQKAWREALLYLRVCSQMSQKSHSVK
jgi:hypothetical protein